MKFIENLIKENKIVVPKEFSFPSDLFINRPVENIVDYFKPWQLLKLLPIGYSQFEGMVKNSLLELVKDGVEYVEFRYSPLTIMNNNNISVEECLNWFISVVDNNIMPIDCRFILTVSRENLDVLFLNKILDALVNVEYRKAIVGVDLAGNETFIVPNDLDFFLREQNMSLD
ncbi:hypothetical protein CAP35_11865 [Chitinophagaceae bacterium IBVUCB1]|nr:hypothetical protein CAP35_11865 [Chitinophagaceae bacterium IBVUCB1]